MHRYAIALLIPLAACGDLRLTGPMGDHHGDPDAFFDDTCGLDFDIAAPQPDLHYDKSLSVIVDESELEGALVVRIDDDEGGVFAPAWQTSTAFPPDAGSWWSMDSFGFELVANAHYTLTVNHCAHAKSVSFFTSPD